jgi:hypothetical protein
LPAPAFLSACLPLLLVLLLAEQVCLLNYRKDGSTFLNLPDHQPLEPQAA